MSPAPWWVTLVIGVLTVTGAVTGSFYAARIGARQTREATDQRERASARETKQREEAAAREQWFTRFQWATELALRTEERPRAAGSAALEVLASSDLANGDYLTMLNAVNANTVLNEFEGDYREDVDETTSSRMMKWRDLRTTRRDLRMKLSSPSIEGVSVTTSNKRVAVKPSLVQAARLRKTINDRLGVPTSPVTEKIAALAGTAQLNGQGHVSANGHVSQGVSKT